MGSLNHFNVGWLAKTHRCRSFVETGTALGDSLAKAAREPFEKLHSIEIDEGLATAAAARFSADQRIKIWHGNSAECLPQILELLPPGPCLWWLDAHFPGAHTGADYAAEPDAGIRLPLSAEIALIAADERRRSDVLLIDDARIYQPGPYAGGDLEDDWPPIEGITRSLSFVREAFGRTHGIVVDYADQGYVMVCPRIRAKKAA